MSNKWIVTNYTVYKCLSLIDIGIVLYQLSGLILLLREDYKLAAINFLLSISLQRTFNFLRVISSTEIEL